MKLLVLHMVVIVVTARLLAVVVRFFGQPEVVGEMIAGILLGPALLGGMSVWRNWRGSNRPAHCPKGR